MSKNLLCLIFSDLARSDFPRLLSFLFSFEKPILLDIQSRAWSVFFFSNLRDTRDILSLILCHATPVLPAMLG